jgi:hypothetical protein
MGSFEHGNEIFGSKFGEFPNQLREYRYEKEGSAQRS